MEWIELTRKGKPLPILLIDAAAMGLNNNFSEFHDKKTRITNFRQAFGARWMAKKDWNNYLKVYRENEDKIIFWMDLWLKQFLELKRFTEKVNKMNLTSKSSHQLKLLFKKYFELNSKACSFAFDYRAVGAVYAEKINSFLKEKIKDPKKLNECIQTIFSLDKPIELHEEKMNLLGIAIKAKKGLSVDKINGLLEKHFQRFGFLGMYIFYGEPLEAKYFKKKLKSLTKKPLPRLEKELLKEKNRFKQNKKETKEIIKKFMLSKSEAKKIRDIRVSLHTSMICDEYYTYTACKISPLLFEIGKRFNLSYNQLIEMRNEEILALFKNKSLSRKELNEINSRFKSHALILEKGKTRVITGKELMAYSKSYLSKMKKLMKLNEIKGETAFPGKVTGKVNLIGRVTDLPSFRKGEIMVTGSTLPQYVPAMKKALAIVTDEGGMLSHAAIMSREFKKPCVIGTKIATRILKEGESIEVDATNGIVRKVGK